MSLRFRHDMLVMVSGGSGITPFISIIRDLMFLSSERKCRTPKLLLVSTFRNSSHLSMLDLLLPISVAPSGSRSLNLQIEAYVTRETGRPAAKTEPIRTIRFKPLPSDAPISSSLGRNSWLWLAAIISSSFVIFLIILGLYTNYYIYPRDLNTNRMDLMTRRTVLTMVFICFSIAVTSTAAFLWNKNQNARETKQIQDLEDSTAAAAAAAAKSLNFQNGDAHADPESLPYQSLVKTMNVHFGARPDLKSKHIFNSNPWKTLFPVRVMPLLEQSNLAGILLESKGSSVGALVCGPKQMRHDVAAICSSGLADNLHFESISFSW